MRRAICYLSVVMNCLCAGSMFTFPLFSVPFARSLHLTATQTTLIGSSIIAGEYLAAPLFGALADKKGPGAVSMSAAVLFVVGWGLLGWRYQVSVDLERKGQQYTAQWVFLAFYAFLAGAATAASYFAAIIASTKSVSPARAGLAIGIPCAIFGLSPLFLSSLASRFTAPLQPTVSTEYELDPGRWLLFLAALLGTVNFIGAFALKELQSEAEATVVAGSSEHDPLLPHASQQQQPRDKIVESHSFFELLSLPSFWTLGVILVLTIGPCEMVQTCLGSIVQALMPASNSIFKGAPITINPAFRIRTRHVQILSLSNTIARLAVGWLSDTLSTSTSSAPPDMDAATDARKWTRRRPSISRIAFLVSSCVLLVFVFLFTSVVLDSTSKLWALSLGVGTAYGAIFTLTPAVVRAIYPKADFGRNWGLLNWFSALSSIAFTPLYGIFSDRATGGIGNGICVGRSCFVSSFVVCTVSVALAALLSSAAWIRLRHVV